MPDLDHCPGCSHHGRTPASIQHGTWWFFRATPSGLIEIERADIPIVSGQTLV